MADWLTVANPDDLPEDSLLCVDVGGDQVCLANVGGRYLALGDVCTHAECSLADGYVEDGNVVCLCHGSVFDLETGEVVTGPAEEAEPVYQVRVEGEEIQVARPGVDTA